jgi:hypothetical protein
MSVSARVVDAQMPDSHYTSKEMTAQFLHYQSECEDEEGSDSECDEDEEGMDGSRRKLTPHEKVVSWVKTCHSFTCCRCGCLDDLH